MFSLNVDPTTTTAGLSNALAIAGFGMDAVKTGIELAQKKDGDGGGG